MTDTTIAPPGRRWTNVKSPIGLGWWIIVLEAAMFLVSNKL